MPYEQVDIKGDSSGQIKHLPHRGGKIFALGGFALLGAVVLVSSAIGAVGNFDSLPWWLFWISGVLAFVLVAVLAPMAWLMGRRDLNQMRAAGMDPTGYLTTLVGLVFGLIATTVVAVVLIAAFCAVVCVLIAFLIGILFIRQNPPQFF